MKTASLMATALALALIPALASVACNKKDDDAAVPVVAPATVAPPPPAAATVAPPVLATAPATGAVAPRPVVLLRDGGAREAGVAAVAFDASTIGFPSFPALQASALPAIASGLVGSILGALPSGLVPPRPAPSK